LGVHIIAVIAGPLDRQKDTNKDVSIDMSLFYICKMQHKYFYYYFKHKEKQ